MKSKPGLDRWSTEIFASVCSQPERCASFPAVIQSPPPRPNCACATAAERPMRRIPFRVFIGALLLDPIAVEIAVERPDVDLAVRDGQPAPVIPRLDLIAARPQLPAVLRIQR